MFMWVVQGDTPARCLIQILFFMGMSDSVEKGAEQCWGWQVWIEIQVLKILFVKMLIQNNYFLNFISHKDVRIS